MGGGLIELIATGGKYGLSGINGAAEGGDDNSYHLSVTETVFANVVSNVIFGMIVGIVIFLIIQYIYNTYIAEPLAGVKSDLQYVKSKVDSMLRLIEKLAGGAGSIASAATNPIGTVSSAGKSIGGLFGF